MTVKDLERLYDYGYWANRKLLQVVAQLAPGQFTQQGVWMSIWVDDVDSIPRHCLEQGLEVTWPPTDEPWGVREMHVRHPDGHVFRISKGIEGAE